jgi:hypothetical protein
MLYLHVHAAQGPLGRPTLIVLDEIKGDTGGFKFIGVPRFHEETAIVPKNPRLDQDYVRNRRGMKLHACPGS